MDFFNLPRSLSVVLVDGLDDEATYRVSDTSPLLHPHQTSFPTPPHFPTIHTPTLSRYPDSHALRHAQSSDPNASNPPPFSTNELRMSVPISLFAHSENAANREFLFGALYLVTIATWVLSSIFIFIHASSFSFPSILIHSPIYILLRHAAPAVTWTLVVSTLMGFVYVSLLRSFVRPIIYGSVLVVPVCASILSFSLLVQSWVGLAKGSRYLSSEFSGVLALAMATFVLVVSVALWMYRKRSALENSIQIIELAARSIAASPQIVPLTFLLMGIYITFLSFWLSSFTSLMLMGTNPTSDSPFAFSPLAYYLIPLHIVTIMWTSFIFINLHRSTIARCVAESQFYPHPGRDVTYTALHRTLNTSFGSISLASLTVTISTFISSCLDLIRRPLQSPHSSVLLMCTVCIDTLLTLFEGVNSLSVTYLSMYETGVCTAAYECTKLLKRSLLSDVGASWTGVLLSKWIMRYAAFSFALLMGLSAYWSSLSFTEPNSDPSSPSLSSMDVPAAYAYISGLITTYVCWSVLDFWNSIIAAAVDAAWLTMMIRETKSARTTTPLRSAFNGGE